MIPAQFKESLIDSIISDLPGSEDRNVFDTATRLSEGVLESIQEHSRFVCRAITVHYFMDNQNYPTTCEQDDTTLKSDTLEGLYAEIARYKTGADHGEKTRYGDYYRAEFGPIYQTIASAEVDPEKITETPVWQAHLDKQVAERLIAAVKAAERADHAAALKETAERAEYVRLANKFGPGAGLKRGRP